MTTDDELKELEQKIKDGSFYKGMTQKQKEYWMRLFVYNDDSQIKETFKGIDKAMASFENTVRCIREGNDPNKVKYVKFEKNE